MAYNSGGDPTLAELITAKFITAKYSKDVIMHTMSNLVVAGRVNTSWKKDLKNGSVVNIPVFSEISTTEVTAGTATTVADAASASPASLTINKWREATVQIDDMSKLEEDADYMAGASKASAYAVVKYVDTTVGALFSTLASSSVYGSDGQAFTDDVILAIMETLDEADVPQDDRSIITDPSNKVDVLKIDKFIRNDYVRELVVPSGKFGNLYNMGVFITNNLTLSATGNYGAMLHRDAIGLVLQQNPRSRMIPLPEKFIIKFTTDVIFGTAVIRPTFGKSFYTRSA